MSDKTQFNDTIDQVQTVTIASGQQISGVLDTFGMSLVGIRMPAAFTGTTLTFQESNSSTGTFRDVYNASGNQLSIPVSTNRTILFTPSDFAGLRYVKIKSGSSEAADRSINVILRGL